MTEYEMTRVSPREMAEMAAQGEVRGIPVFFAVWPAPSDDVEIVIYARRKVRLSGK
jgi:hypothetical protein